MPGASCGDSKSIISLVILLGYFPKARQPSILAGKHMGVCFFNAPFWIALKGTQKEYHQFWGSPKKDTPIFHSARMPEAWILKPLVHPLPSIRG